MSPREIADVTGCTSVSLGATSGRHLVQVHINCELARNVTGNLHLVTLSQGPIETGMVESGQVPSPESAGLGDAVHVAVPVRALDSARVVVLA